MIHCSFCLVTLFNRYLIDEGRQGSPKMMSVGLHCRLARPGIVAGISEFIDFCKAQKKDVWICTREEIADHWFTHHPPNAAIATPGSPMAERENWKGPAKSPSGDGAAGTDGEKEESEVDEADGDII
mgnify:CR=1 FL=1